MESDGLCKNQDGSCSTVPDMLQFTSHLSIESALVHGQPQPKSKFQVAFSSDIYGRMTGKPSQDLMDFRWKSLSSTNPRLHNASKFRLAEFSPPADVSGMSKLSVGLTDYKTFVATNLASDSGHLQQEGMKDFNCSQAYMSDPLGVGSLIHTLDDQLVFGQRAEWTCESPGLLDRPGGHPEPDNCQDFSSDLVLEEIFASILREIKDELNLSQEHLEKPLVLGVIRNKNHGGRPSLEFITRCNLPSSHVVELYKTGQQSEADETSDLRVISITDAFQALSTSGMHFAPAAQGALQLYRGVL